VLTVPRKAPRHKPSVKRDGDGQRIERFENHTPHLNRRLEPPAAGGRGLALGQAVHHVVVHDVGDVGVAADRVDEVVAALSVHVAVPADRHDRQRRIGRLDGRRRRQRPAMQPVEYVALLVVWQLGGLADAGDQH